MSSSVADALLDAARVLRDDLDRLHFGAPIAQVYNPLRYAWAPYEAFVTRFAHAPNELVFLGMNPGPFGMMQTGVPFGEVAAVRDWMGIEGLVERPAREHPKRRIDGFSCKRSEVSGRRVWGWAAGRWGSAERFFERHYVLNYCPLAFLEESGRNFTPDKLPVAERRALYEACDRHLLRSLDALRPALAVGIGGFAQKRLQQVLAGRDDIRIGTVLHPSPASPMANRGWAEQVDAQLAELGVPRE